MLGYNGGEESKGSALPEFYLSGDGPSLLPHFLGKKTKEQKGKKLT